MKKSLLLWVSTLLLLLSLGTPSSSLAQLHPGPGPPPPSGLSEAMLEDVNPIPTVVFPTEQEIFTYFSDEDVKTEFTELGNASQGAPSNLQTAVIDNTTWAAWQGNVNETNHVFLAVSYDGGNNFTDAVQLSPPDTGNASKLQLQVSDDGNSIFLTWQDTDKQTGKSRIFFSSSMNSGQLFRSYPLNSPDEGDAIDPRLTVRGEDYNLSWLQQGDCGGYDEQGGVSSPANLGDIYTPCSHGSRW